MIVHPVQLVEPSLVVLLVDKRDQHILENEVVNEGVEAVDHGHEAELPVFGEHDVRGVVRGL